MRFAVNQIGFNAEVFTPTGWRAFGCGQPYATREAAQDAVDALKAESPELEFRVNAALEAA